MELMDITNNFLYKTITKSYKSNKVILDLLISIEKKCYNDNNFFCLCKKIKNFFNENNDHKVKTFQINIGDILNRHNWYYRYCEKYISDNNLIGESQIPKEICNRFHKESYVKGSQQGKEWFKKNLNAINQLIPKSSRLDKDFQINNNITVLYKGNKNNPRIEYICYEYWLKHPKYKIVERTLNEACKIDNSVINRAFFYEINYFYNLYLKKGGFIKNEILFKQQSFKYLFDETIPYIIKHQKHHNLIELYVNSVESKITQTFRGRKAQKNLAIKKLMEKGQSLEGADQRKFITISLEEE